MKKMRFKGSFCYIFLMVISVVFVFTFAFSINPIITESLEVDASCFYVIGRDMLHGKMPYLDFVDNKGPVTYIIYALSSAISSFPWGILFISAMMIFASLVILKYICKKLNIKHFYVICLLYLFFYVCICSNGGYTEDMALPLTLGAFAVLLFSEEQLLSKKSIFISGLLYGILFWLCAFTRLNNAVTIGVLTAFSGIHILTKKQIKSFFIFVGSFLVGSFAIILPIAVWLAKNGAMQEFLNQFILNNFKYSSAGSAMSKSSLFIFEQFGHRLYLLVAIGIICSIFFIKSNPKERRPISIASIVAICITAFSFVSMTNLFLHYTLVVFAPAFFGFILLFSSSNGDKNIKTYSKKLIAAICCIAVLTTFTAIPQFYNGVAYAGNFVRTCLNGTITNVPNGTDMSEKVSKMTDHIPENERNSVFSINVNPCFYALSGISPSERIFVCSSLFTEISDDYKNEFIGYFKTEPPKWLVTAKPLEKTEICGGLETQLIKQYILIDSVDETFYLYKLGD